VEKKLGENLPIDATDIPLIPNIEQLIKSDIQETAFTPQQ